MPQDQHTASDGLSQAHQLLVVDAAGAFSLTRFSPGTCCCLPVRLLLTHPNFGWMSGDGWQDCDQDPISARTSTLVRRQTATALARTPTRGSLFLAPGGSA